LNGAARGIRTGDWVTTSRIRTYSAMILAFAVLMFGALIGTSQRLNDYQGRPLGTDFSNVYAAGKWTLAGRPEAPFDPELQHEMEKQAFGPDTPLYGWHYPPMFLALAALLASLPYVPALLVWQIATLAAYLATMRAIIPRPEIWLPALAFPAVTLNIAHGQNGFLSAALFGGGLLLLDRRPVVAGTLIGLLCYKPQFGILIPLALVAAGYWRAVFTAAATVITVCALSWLAIGGGAWLAFYKSLEFTRTVVLEQGGTGFHKIQSMFAAWRMWGAPLDISYIAQGTLSAIVAGLIFFLWRSPAAFALKAAALLIGAMLTTPYLLDYDLMLMAPALAVFVAHATEGGFHSYERSAIAFCWIVPLVARSVGEQTNTPLGLLALLLLFGLVLRRALADCSSIPRVAVRRRVG
jgi:hypothetical protein